MRFELQGGVLAIGSLYWQDHLYQNSNTIRKDWRNMQLRMDGAIDVQVPIRYGRLTTSPVDNRQTYTMVFDNRLHRSQYGTAKAVPFSRPGFGDFNSIRGTVRRLSQAEGHDCDFIKGYSAWAICCVLFNPCVPSRIRTYLLDAWKGEFESTPEKYQAFKDHLHNGSQYSVKPSGALDISWPSEVDGLDFLVATATRPVPRETLDRLSAWSIADLVPNRPYFHQNLRHGITTFQDEEILRCLGKEA